MIEIEHRGLLTKESYEKLATKLSREAKLLGKDDKEVTYYIYTDKLLKAVRNLSQGTAKLSLKLNVLGGGSAFQEFEVPLPIESFETTREICNRVLSPIQIITGTQKRTNYEYGGVEIALKWSEDWEYHVELEMRVSSEEEKGAADRQIIDVAQRLGITLMSEKEVADFLRTIRTKHASIVSGRRI